MAVFLSKGGNISLSVEAEGSLSELTVGLGWNPRAADGAAFDLDASVFMATGSGKVRSDGDFIFYNQSKSACGSVEFMGYNTTGGGDDDDEQVKVDVTKVPAEVQKLAFGVTIYDAESRKQNFGMVSNAYIRIVNDANGKELSRFDLGEDFSTETAAIFGEVYRSGSEWKFRAVGQGFAGDLGSLAKSFGVNV
jgi:tellurium resistance protein TerD